MQKYSPLPILNNLSSAGSPEPPTQLENTVPLKTAKVTREKVRVTDWRPFCCYEKAQVQIGL